MKEVCNALRLIEIKFVISLLRKYKNLKNFAPFRRLQLSTMVLGRYYLKGLSIFLEGIEQFIENLTVI